MTAPPPTLGVVVGLRQEAAIARRFATLIAVTGGRAARAEDAARGLVDQGATVLMSFGIAGGLAPDQASGTLVLADRVILVDRAIDADAAWRARLQAILKRVHVGAVMGEDRIVQRAVLKAALFRRHGALAVDLESGGVARAAVARGLPFAVVRAIADPATRDLPAAALVGLNEEGGVALGAVLRSLARTPGQLPRLIAAARDSRAAMNSLLGGARDLAAALRVA